MKLNVNLHFILKVAGIKVAEIGTTSLEKQNLTDSQLRIKGKRTRAKSAPASPRHVHARHQAPE